MGSKRPKDCRRIPESHSRKNFKLSAMKVRAREANTDYGLKRLFDLCVAVPVSVLAAPVMLLTSLLVVVFLGRPVLFRQQRPGRNAAIFTLFKFRTMTQEFGPDRE